MLTRAAGLGIRRHRWILWGAGLFFALAAVLGGPVASHLSGNGGFTDPAAPSSKALSALEKLGAGDPQLVFVVAPHGGSVTSAAGAAEGVAFTADIRARVQQVAGPTFAASVGSYWTLGRPVALAATNGSSAEVLARLSDSEDASVTRAKQVIAGLSALAARDGVTVTVTGTAAVFDEVGTQITHDLLRAESIAIPVTAVLLILVFGSAIAALLPLILGIIAVLGSDLVLRLLVTVTPVSVYATNLATSLGLGLGIDYGLFVLTRYREEQAAGADPHQALVTAVQTAGRTVLFSAVTVATALAALLVFPLFFLRSFAYAGVAAVAFAALSSLLVLPALITVLGPRLDRYDLRVPLRRLLHLPPPPVAGLGPADGGVWHRIATFVMRRPLVLGGAVVALLVVAGVPFTSVHFGLPDDRVLPTSAPAHRGGDILRTEYATNAGGELYAVVPALPHSSGDHTPNAQVAAYAQALSRVSGVTDVSAVTGTYVSGRLVDGPGPETAQFAVSTGSWVSIAPSVEPYSAAGERLVHELRAVPVPVAGTLIGGASAQLVDSISSIGAALPWAIGIIAAATLIVLFLFTGSVLLPVKAILMTLLTLSATFGVMVWGFQEGHLSGVLGFTPTGTLDTTIPVLMFCVVFGLSMDYEVFLLSRIREEYLATGDNRGAVARGLERTGRLVTAAAGLLAIVFLAFTSSSITFIQLLGLGSAFAILVDATLVRGVLVPAFMALLGDANWWAPGPLRRLHDRIGISENVAAVDRAQTPRVPGRMISQ